MGKGSTSCTEPRALRFDEPTGGGFAFTLTDAHFRAEFSAVIQLRAQIERVSKETPARDQDVRRIAREMVIRMVYSDARNEQAAP